MADAQHTLITRTMNGVIAFRAWAVYDDAAPLRVIVDEDGEETTTYGAFRVEGQNDTGKNQVVRIDGISSNDPEESVIFARPFLVGFESIVLPVPLRFEVPNTLRVTVVNE